MAIIILDNIGSSNLSLIWQEQIAEKQEGRVQKAAQARTCCNLEFATPERSVSQLHFVISAEFAAKLSCAISDLHEMSTLRLTITIWGHQGNGPSSSSIACE